MQEEVLSTNFKLSEFLNSDLAIRRGIPNDPDENVISNIRNYLAPGMQRVRDRLGSSVHISSGFRCFTLNSALGGSKNSQHMEGLAADFTAPGFGTPKEIAQFLVKNADSIKFDQVIWEGQWVHVSFAAAPRNSILTAHFEGGKATYTPGIA